jgi:hypothetical protein
MFFINNILTCSIFDEEYECHHSLVLEAFRENHLYVKPCLAELLLVEKEIYLKSCRKAACAYFFAFSLF